MKKLQRTLLVVVLQVFLLVVPATLNIQAQTTDLIYFVQIAAFQKGNPGNYDHLRPVGSLFVEDDNTGVKRVVVGYFDSRSKAQTVLQKVRGLGHKDAFINKRKKSNTDFTGTTPAKPAPKAPTKVNNPNTPPPKQIVDVRLNPNEVFIISLGTYNNITKARFLGVAGNLGKVYVDRNANNQQTYFLGGFQNWPEVQSRLDHLQKSGYAKAKVYRVNRSFMNLSLVDNRSSKTTTTVPPPPPTKVANVPAPTPAPTTVAPPPSANRRANPAVDIAAFGKYFDNSKFAILNVDTHDPLQKGNKSKELMGSNINDRFLLYLLKDVHPNAQNGNFYAIRTFPITSQHEGYIIREAGRTSQEASNISLYILDKNQGKFISKELLSSVSRSASKLKVTKTLISDLDYDGALDLLSYSAEDFYQSNGKLQKTKDANAKVWRKSKYVKAKIEDKDELIKQLGLY